MPSLWQRAKNFGREMPKAAMDAFRCVSKDEKEARIQICRKCDYIINAGTAREQCSHPKCGCFMQWKSRLRSMDCPDGRWPKVKNASESSPG